jgi:hypothetical protein
MTVQYLHDQAMLHADVALLHRYRSDGSPGHARLSAQAAAVYDAAAASLLAPEPQNEPTRAILYRSAATCALWAEDWPEAERLADLGLCGYPPPRVRQELWDARRKARAEQGLLTLAPIGEDWVD